MEDLEGLSGFKRTKGGSNQTEPALIVTHFWTSDFFPNALARRCATQCRFVDEHDALATSSRVVASIYNVVELEQRYGEHLRTTSSSTPRILFAMESLAKHPLPASLGRLFAVNATYERSSPLRVSYFGAVLGAAVGPWVGACVGD